MSSLYLLRSAAKRKFAHYLFLLMKRQMTRIRQMRQSSTPHQCRHLIIQDLAHRLEL